MFIAVLALLITCISVQVGKDSLKQSHADSLRNLQNWRQSKWFDLYFEADKAYDLLDRFQTKHANTGTFQWNNNKNLWMDDWNELMYQMRRVHSMAAVFPKTPIIDSLLVATAVFSNEEEALKKTRLQLVFEAVDGVRMQALVDTSVLQNPNIHS